VRPWLARARPGLAALNGFAQGIRTASGRQICFVPPRTADPYYEVKVFESGEIPTRADNWHDLFNALVWLAFPRTKARLNALHAAEIPREGGRRGPRRDMLTLFDEGGALVVTSQADLIGLIRERRWRALFWDQRERLRAQLRIVVFGHAVMEKALEPFPAITCKVVFAPPGRNLDDEAAQAISSAALTPRGLAPLPVFGYPGWHPDNGRPDFYDDRRVFRPAREVKSAPGVGQAAAALRAEESPGSEERDAG